MIHNEKDPIFESFFILLMELEGGYSDRKEDRGGRTNFGITQRLLDSFVKINGYYIQDVKELTREQAKEIYFDEFYTKVRKVENAEIHYNLFDMCVNSGHGNYRKLLIYLSDNNLLNFPSAVYSYRTTFFKEAKSSEHNLYGWLNRLNLIKLYFEKYRNEKKGDNIK